ncbi:MAG TPA: chromosome segregation protein SMC [Planctomycetes bacterium]|nr:chromosome segregation protein SMC [Planctomycetota bacterium]HIK81673.1 chromosome segregation protein SMC [Planctomycetota bacterium]
MDRKVTLHLKRIFLCGFKSFADPIEFDFDRGTSAIVGPNGCGKSNVVDAFRWVLGERSAKGLRGTEMLDVIFKGTRSRPAVARAEVRLLFDNEDGLLPVDAAEVEIGRILLRDGTSEYQVNRKRCRLKDVLAIFADTGIGADGYSVLGQGKVDTFLNSNAQERRRIFEEAAGISSFRKKRSEAENRLARGERELIRVNDQLAEIERRIRSLKMQAGKARRFIEDRDRFQMISSVLSSEEVVALRQERERVTFRLQWRNTLREMLSDLSASLETELDEVRTRLEDVHRELENTRQQETERRVALEGIDARRIQFEEQARHSSERNEERNRQQLHLIEVEQQYQVRRTEVRNRLKVTISELREYRSDLEVQDKVHRSLFSDRDLLDEGIRNQKDRDLELVFEETRLRNTVAALTGDLRGQDSIRDRRTAEGQEFRAQQLELEEISQRHDGQILEAIEMERDSLSSAELLGEEVDQRIAVLDQARGHLAALRSDNESSEGRLRFLVELEESLDGLGKGTQRLINSSEPAAGDIRGLLARLIEADPDTARMVDAVLGRVLETVVLQGRTPLENRIRALEKILAGESASIVSLEDEVMGQKPRSAAPDGLETLSNRVQCESICRPVVDALLGQVLVARDLEEAISYHRLNPGYCVVTTDGTVIEPWGAVRLPATSKVGLVSRRVEMTNLKQSMDEIRSRLEMMSEQESALEESISARRGEIQRLEQEAGRAHIEADHSRREKEKTRESLRRFKERIETLETDMEQAQGHHVEITSLRDIARVNLKKVGEERAVIEQFLEEHEQRIGPLDAQLGDLDEDLQRIRLVATRTQERIASDWREQRRLAEEVDQRIQQRQNIAQQLTQESQRCEEILEKIVILAEEEVSYRGELEKIASSRDEQDRRLESCRLERSAAEKRQRECRSQGDQIQKGREDDLLSANECQVRIEGIRKRVSEDLEMSLEEAPIEEWRNTLLEGIPQGKDLTDVLRPEYQEIQARMRRNSNVNLQAVEELETEETRHSAIAEEMADLTRSRDLIREAMEALDNQCRTRFLDSFEEVRKNFQEIFSLMFGGGVADLELEEGEDPLVAGIKVKARPPGKRISSLELLSGGERALAAISVIFALFKARPSPFCILDEVDAPLDEQNTRRFVRVLQEFAKTSQFLIITHSRITMTEAERLYGVTMEEEGVSCRVVVKIAEANRWVEEKIPAQQRATSATSSAGSPAARDPFLDRGTTKRGITVDVDESTSPQS